MRGMTIISSKSRPRHPRLQPVLRLHGSKWRAADRIISEFPADFRSRCYVEVFGGTGAVIATKPPSRQDVYNDLDGQLVNFWLQLQHHPNELARVLRGIPYSAAMWDHLRKTRGLQPTEILRAAAFAVASLCSKNGTMASFSRSPKQSAHSLLFIGRKLRRLAARFRNVRIENLDFRRAIAAYDSANTLFYADPPYPGRHAYRVKFGETDFRDLAEMLRRAKAKAIISCGTEHGKLLRGWRMKRVAFDYTVAIGRVQKRFEILAFNW